MIDDRWYLQEVYQVLDRRGSSNDFECIVESPPVSKPNFGTGMIEYEAGPRMRVIIEGKRELVQRVLAVAGPEIQAVLDDLKGESPCK